MKPPMLPQLLMTAKPVAAAGPLRKDAGHDMNGPVMHSGACSACLPYTRKQRDMRCQIMPMGRSETVPCAPQMPAAAAMSVRKPTA